MSYDVYNIMVRLVFYLVCIVSVVIDFRGRSVIAWWRARTRPFGRQERYNNIIITDDDDYNNNNNNDMVMVPVRYNVNYVYPPVLYGELCD